MGVAVAGIMLALHCDRARSASILRPKTETFEEATQVGSGTAIAIEIDLVALRHAALHLLQLALQASGAFA
jgi:hypothetical protein